MDGPPIDPRDYVRRLLEAYRAARRGQHERVLGRFQRHPALVQLRRRQTVRTTHRPRSAWSRSIRFQHPAHILVRVDRQTLHDLSPVARAAREWAARVIR